MAFHIPGVLGPALPNVGHAWDRFRETHMAWFDHLPKIDPLYCLNEPIIARLEQPRLGQPPLLDHQQAAAERDLNELCRQSKAVGFLDGLPIVYRFFSPPLPLPSEAMMSAADWTQALRQDIEQLAQRAAASSVRLKGYAGWLLTEPAFLQACQVLADQWNALSSQLRPRFPLRRGSFHANLPEEYRATSSDAVAVFETAFFDFCERWGLAGMTSWDLPDPQGTLFPNLLPPDAPALPRRGIHLFIPLHYPLTGDDDLLRQILQQQRCLAADTGIDRTAAGLPHYEAYATLFEVLHWERAINGRFGQARRPPGFVAHIREAIAESVHISVDQVEKWRKAISACRRGRRNSIRALKVKP
jgi:hypothetical protein